MLRSLAVILVVLLQSCAPAVLSLSVSPSRMVRPKEVRAVAHYTGGAGPADEVIWQVCEYTTRASIDAATRTFEAFFPCRTGGFPRVTLLKDGQIVATVTTAAPIVIGATQ